ncbi:MAG: hypothetical protein ACXVPN_06310 [Bacteroidia bacterium]
MHKISVIILLFLCGSFSLKAQSNDRLSSSAPGLLWSEVVIGIPNLKAEQFERVKTVLKEIKGLKWSGYCEDQKYVFLMVNRNILPDDKFITERILDVDNGLKLYFKTSGFTVLLNQCGDKEKTLSR